MPDALPRDWLPERPFHLWPRPSLGRAVWRGASGRCPACGGGRLFAGWLRPVAACARCGAPLGALRADDAPPYVVIFVTGHLLVGAMLLLERLTAISARQEALIFMPLTAGAALALLRPVKGAVMGLMLRLGLMPPPHG